MKNNLNKLNNEQKKFVDAVDSGNNVYLSGLGGTGKSYVVKYVIDKAKKSKKNVIVCAPTGIAALNVGGCTIHRALGIRPERTLEQNPYYKLDNDSPLLDCDLMIIDEISMCRLDLFDYLSNVLYKAANKRKEDNKNPCQLVVVGDFNQLPPVIKDEKKILDRIYGYDVDHGYPFLGKEWKNWNFKNIELKKVIRQKDEDFISALNLCRNGDMKGLRWIEKYASQMPKKNAIVLFGRNKDANNENNRRLKRLRAPSFVYQSETKGEIDKSDMPTAEKLELKNGARVMALVNDTEETFMNGSLGIVKKCLKDKVLVKFDNGCEIEIEPYKWNVMKPISNHGRTQLKVLGSFTQIPLKLAYALTIHKSQGQTFENIVLKPDCWDPGQLYTALSRVTSLEGLFFVNRCSSYSLVTSKKVIDFYSKNNKNSNFQIFVKDVDKLDRKIEYIVDFINKNNLCSKDISKILIALSKSVIKKD